MVEPQGDSNGRAGAPGASGSAGLPAFNRFDPAFIADPYPVLSALREQTAVAPGPLPQTWLALRHDDVDLLVREHQTFAKDPRKAKGDTLLGRLAGGDVDGAGLSMLMLDPPDHTRLRGLVNRAFTPRAVEALRPRSRRIAEDLLDAVAGQERFDLVAALAAPFPTTVIAEMIGVDPAMREQFKRWSDTMAGSNGGQDLAIRGDALAARTALTGYFREEIAKRRATPRGDLISGLIAAQEENDRLSDAEMVSTLVLLLVAGNVTTTDLIGNGMLALLHNPEQMATLRQNPALIPNAVEEMLRYDSPVVSVRRVPVRDVQIGGCPVGAGETVLTSLASANHDPAAYPDPDRFDVNRQDTHHHSFGGGIHYCLGAPLARMEAQEAFAALLSRFPRIELDPDAPPVRRMLPTFRGLVSLPVVVTDK